MPSNSSSCDVAIVGGGVIGLAVGWRAAQRGLDVVVLERGAPGCGTSRVAAGMLAPISEASRNEQDVLRLGLESARLYPAFAAELADACSLDTGYLACGTLLAARDEDEAASLARELELRIGLGLPVARLRSSDARHLEPALAPTLRLALDIPEDHAIDPHMLAAALAQALARRRGALRCGADVSEVLVAEDRVRGVRLASGEQVLAGQVVIAAGVWSGAVNGIPREARVPIRPVKGQIMRLHDPAGPGLLTRVLRFSGGYVVPRGDGRYVIGATMEERGFDTTVTAGAAYELLRDASELLPGVGELVIDDFSAGLRPGTPDNSPVIGRGDLDGLHWATGHYRGGILLAPVTAELLAASLAGERLPELAAPFAPQRFGRLAVGV